MLLLLRVGNQDPRLWGGLGHGRRAGSLSSRGSGAGFAHAVMFLEEGPGQRGFNSDKFQAVISTEASREAAAVHPAPTGLLVAFACNAHLATSDFV